MFTENANKPRIIGYIDLDNYSPYPKNPKIANLFKEIGLADELGSGIRKIVKYTNIYSGMMPEFKDDEIFRVKIPLQAYDNIEVGMDNEKIKTLIYTFISSSDYRTRKEINEYIYPILSDDKAIMNNKVRSVLTYLRNKKLIKNIGSDTNSKWIAEIL